MAVQHTLEQYGLWQNRQLLSRDVLGWLPSLLPYTLTYWLPHSKDGRSADSLHLGTAAAAACQQGSTMHCACTGAASAAGGLLNRGAAWVQVPFCHALAQDHDSIFMPVVVWPLLLVMLFQRRLYLAWRTQLVAAARLATLCVPPLLFLLLPPSMQLQHLEQRGVWLDKPGGGLAAVAAQLGLQELQLKQLLSLLATAWMEHALLLPPSWEGPVSAIQAAASVAVLVGISQALGQPTWPWAAGLAGAAWLLCHLLPVYSAVRREQHFQAQYQQLVTAVAEDGSTVASSSSASSSGALVAVKTVSPPPSPRFGAGSSWRFPEDTPGTSSSAQAGVSASTAAAAAAAAAAGLKAALSAQQGLGRQAGHALYARHTGNLGTEHVGASACISFAAPANAQHGSGNPQHPRLVAALQAAQGALATACGTPAAVLSISTGAAAAAAAGDRSVSHQGPGRPASAGLLVYVAPSPPASKLSQHSSSSNSSQMEDTPSKHTGGLLVRLQAVAAGDHQVLLACWAWQERSGCAAMRTVHLWCSAVGQLLQAQVPGVTSVTTPHMWAQDVATAGSMNTGMFQGGQDEAGEGMMLARASQGTALSPPATAAAAAAAAGASQEGGMRDSTTGSNRAVEHMSSRWRFPADGSQAPGHGAGHALQWAFQLQWHAPLCLPDPSPEALEAPELLLQLSLQPAPGSSARGPYSGVAGGRAFFVAPVATSSPSGSQWPGSPHPAAQAAPAATAAAAAAAQVGAAAPPVVPCNRQQAQSLTHLHGALGDLVTLLVTNEAVTSCWSWCEEEVLGLAAAQQQPPHTSPSGGQLQEPMAEAAPGAGSGFPVAVQLQLPQALSSGEVHELVLAHRLPPSTHSNGEGEVPLQALALVPLCVLPAAAYQEVEQHLLPAMWAEAHALVRRGTEQAGDTSPGTGSDSSSLQDYAYAFIGSSSSSGSGTTAPQVAAAEALTWHHWCQLAGDMNRAASLSRLLIAQAAQQPRSPQQQAAAVLCQQELQGLAWQLLDYFLGHRLVSCCVAVLQQLPPDLHQEYRAAVQQQLATWDAADQQQQQQQQLQQQQQGQGRQQGQLRQEGQQRADANHHYQQQQVAEHADWHVPRRAQQSCGTASGGSAPCAAGGAAVEGADAADNPVLLATNLSGLQLHSADCALAPAAAGDSGKLVGIAFASTGSLQDSAFEGATEAGSSSCSGARGATYSRSSSAGSSGASREATGQ